MSLIRQAVVLGTLILMFLVCDGVDQCSDSNPCPDSPCFIESCLGSGACYNEPIQFEDGLKCEEDCQCKSNRCEYGKCVKKCTNDDECEDGDIYCTDDYCLRGYCRSDNICPDCTTKDDCDDENPCTDDSCVSGTCAYSDIWKEPDGDPCKLSCECDSGLCDNGVCAKTCTNEDQCGDAEWDPCNDYQCINGACTKMPVERVGEGKFCIADCNCISGECENNECAPIGPCPQLSAVMDIINKWANGNEDIGTVIDYINRWSSCAESSGAAPSTVEQQKTQLMAMLQPNETLNPVLQCDPGYHLENGQCVQDQLPSDPTCELAYVKNLINNWANDKAELSEVIEAINHWASSECTASSGLSPVAVEQQKAQLMAMLQPNEALNPVLECDPGYRLENGQCVQDILQCDPGYHLENGQCVQDIPQCDPGYHLENGQCVQDIPQCDPGYHLENGQCVQDIPQCDPGYHLENGQCVQDQMPSDPTCELAYVTNLINKWANDKAELSEVIEAINHWASSECTASSGLSPVAVEQQKAQLMAMLQNPSNQETSDQEQSGQWPSDQEQSGQWPSDQEQSGQWPSDREQSGQWPSDQEQSGQWPSDQEQSGQWPFDQGFPY